MGRPWIVLKFGGTSVADRAGWETVGRRVEQLLPTHRVWVVASAVAGVSNRLEASVREALVGRAAAAAERIRATHRTLASELGLDAADLAEAAALEERMEGGLELIDENTVEFTEVAEDLANGKTVFNRQCASCHRTDGGGQIGPNLTDDYYGRTANQLYSSIAPTMSLFGRNILTPTSLAPRQNNSWSGLFKLTWRMNPTQELDPKSQDTLRRLRPNERPLCNKEHKQNTNF